MLKEITMPAGGQTTDTSVIGTWLVKKGDKVKRGDALLEIETDKATLTVESFAKGTVLAILAEEGDEASAGDVIAYIGEESDLPEVERRLNAGTTQSAEDKQELPEQKISAGRQEDEYQPIDLSAPIRYEAGTEENTAGGKEALGDIKAMPNAKKLAREEKVSLKDVAEYAGKSILKRQDVQAYLERAEKIAPPDAGNADEKIPLTNMRKVIARRMTESAQNIPAFQAAVEVNMERCIAFRKTINEARKEGKISYNDILFKCMEAAIRRYPYLNASYTEEAIILHKDVNIGLAVSVEAGLVVPVVKQVNGKGIEAISAENRINIKKAREGKLMPEDMSGGTITLSNLGMYPITEFNAIINPPEVCILAVGAMEEKPVFEQGQWRPIPVMKITGSFDHRVIDGAYGAEFLAELKKVIENPALALL